MRSISSLATAAALIAAAGVAQAAPTLLGEKILVRLDLQGGSGQYIVGAGQEITDLNSPVGRPWKWSIDFAPDGSFEATATVTATTTLFFPYIGFASDTVGLIPADPNEITSLTTYASVDGDFGASAGTIVPRDGVYLSFTADRLRGPFQVGTTASWSGRIALGDVQQTVPAPATLALALTALGLLGASRARRR